MPFLYNQIRSVVLDKNIFLSFSYIHVCTETTFVHMGPMA